MQVRSSLQRTTRHAPTFAARALLRLPPPGNGKCVHFDEVIELADPEGHVERYVDPLLQNDHFTGLLDKLNSSLKDNEFGYRFGQLLRSPAFHERHIWVDNCEWQAPEKDGGSPKGHQEIISLLPFAEESEQADARPVSVLSLADSIGSTFSPFRPCKEKEEADQYGVDCRAVIQAMDWFNHHACIPLFPQDIRWKSCSLPWLTLPRWQGACPQELHFHLDGSKVDHHAGAAVVLWIFTTEWQWAGGVMHQVEEGCNAFEAEVVAHMLMAKWIHDLWRTQSRHWMHTPRVVCHYDSTSAAGSALGWCQARDLCAMKARGLPHLLKQGRGIEIEAEHTYGHQGDPGNEAADALAKFAAVHPSAKDSFWHGFCKETTLPSLYVQWFWMLARPDLRDFWRAGCLKPPIPLNEEDAQVVQELQSWQNCTRPAEPLQLRLKMVTCNVMTLSQRYVSAHAAALGFLDQCHDKHMAVVALQETRLKRLRLGHPEYVTVAHPSHKGHGGVLLALHRRLFRVQGAEEVKEALAEKHISVVASDHELLIARVWYGSLDILVTVAHAPHTGRPQAEVEAFWTSLRSVLPPYLQAKDMLVLVDANARVGSRISNAIQGHHAEEENGNGACFHEFLIASHLWVPSTFSSFHMGPGHTWTHAAGNQSRIDYIAVPSRWQFTSMCSWTDFQLQAHGHLHDHHAVCLEFRCHLPGSEACLTVKRPAPLQPLGPGLEACTQMEWATHYMPPIDWALDVHQHAHELTRRFSDGVHWVVPRRQPFHRKPHFSTETKAVIEYKAELRGHLLHLQYGRRLLGLRSFFLAWQGQCQQCHHHWDLQFIAQEEKYWAKQWASLYLVFKRVRNQAAALQRQDTRAFFDGLAEEWTACDQPTKVKELWLLVKRHLPKNRARQQARPAVQHESLHDQWHPHLEQLEAGAHDRLENLYQELLLEDNQFTSHRTMCKLEEIPTLVQVENSLRSTRPGKASGPDGLPSEWIHAGAGSLAPWVFDLVLKMFWTAKEPIQWKGGILHMLPKVPMPVSAAVPGHHAVGSLGPPSSCTFTTPCYGLGSSRSTSWSIGRFCPPRVRIWQPVCANLLEASLSPRSASCSHFC